MFYFICGLGAAGLQLAVFPASQLPSIGASGAIAGVMATYLFHPLARVRDLPSGGNTALGCGLGLVIVLVPGLLASLLGLNLGLLAPLLGLFCFALVFLRPILPDFVRRGTGALPLILFVGLWIVLQVASGMDQIGTAVSGGVGYFSHIGGFATGLLLVLPFEFASST